jgi:hypothetical protein
MFIFILQTRWSFAGDSRRRLKLKQKLLFLALLALLALLLENPAVGALNTLQLWTGSLDKAESPALSALDKGSNCLTRDAVINASPHQLSPGSAPGSCHHRDQIPVQCGVSPHDVEASAPVNLSESVDVAHLCYLV